MPGWILESALSRGHMINNSRPSEEPLAGFETPDDMRPPEGMWAGVWRRFRRHPGAVAGSFVFLILVLAIILV